MKEHALVIVLNMSVWNKVVAETQGGLVIHDGDISHDITHLDTDSIICTY